ncbi:MAG: ribosome small subunit-dependent GTPase A, partial [Bacteroidota bacterium]
MATQPPNHQATVVRTTGLWHEVRMEDGEVVSARVPGRFRLREEMVTNPVAVGDQVMVAMQADETGVIEEILPRRNKLSRKAAGRKAGMEHVIVANVDFAWCVQSVKLPRFNIGFIDRFFVVAEAYGIPAGLVVNKLDLLADKKRERLGEAVGVYEDLGYPVLLVSAETGEGLDDFSAALDGQLSAIAGPSGVGKSTLLNAIEPGLDLRTGTVSKKTQKGRHTTTFAELHRVGDAGYVIDTPGIRE